MSDDTILEIRATCEHGAWEETEPPIDVTQYCSWCDENVVMEYRVMKTVGKTTEPVYETPESVTVTFDESGIIDMDDDQ